MWGAGRGGDCRPRAGGGGGCDGCGGRWGVSLTALAARLLDGETERSRMTAGSRLSSWGMAQPVIGGHGDQGQQARWRRGGLGLEAGRWATEEPGPRTAGLLTSGLLVFHNKMAANSEDYTSQHSLERGAAT